MFLPVGVVATVGVGNGVAVVINSVCTAAFMAGGSRNHGGLSNLYQIVNLKCLDACGVENFRFVFERDVGHTLAQICNFDHTFVHRCLCTEHTGVGLHGVANIVRNILCIFTVG